MRTIKKGIHEELYDMLRTGSVDLVLNDQRRAFSDEYVNFELLKCGCYIEISKRSPFENKENVTLEDLEHTTCVLEMTRRFLSRLYHSVCRLSVIPEA